MASPNRRLAIRQLRKDVIRAYARVDRTLDAAPVAGPYAGVTAVSAAAPPATNGDETNGALLFAGNFAKGLAHDPATGVVVPARYQAFVEALDAAEASAAFPDPGAIAGIDAVTTAPAFGRPFVNPLGGLNADVTGLDPRDLAQPPAPTLQSGVAAAEMVELYWMALMRDLPFARWSGSGVTADAVAELAALNAAPGSRFAEHYERPGGARAWSTAIGANRLFRGAAPGNEAGYYVSQFLLLPAPFGTLTIDQRQKTAAPGRDWMTTWQSWLAVQMGADATGADLFDATPRYIRNLRDLATYVHFDALHEAYFNAALILLSRGAAVSPTNPYRTSGKQQGFGVLGGPQILALVSEIATRALKTVWNQKWYVHRRIRPEGMGGRIDAQMRGVAGLPYAIDGAALNSQAVARTCALSGSCLLPQAFPEGSPMHPSYGAGHATVAGACVTILKALFDTRAAMPDPVVPTDDGLALVADPSAPALTVGGELNKLAANVAIGRNAAGVHYRTDYTKSLVLGELVAVSMLREIALTKREQGASFTFDPGTGPVTRPLAFAFESFSGDMVLIDHDARVVRLDDTPAAAFF